MSSCPDAGFDNGSYHHRPCRQRGWHHVAYCGKHRFLLRARGSIVEPRASVRTVRRALVTLRERMVAWPRPSRLISRSVRRHLKATSCNKPLSSGSSLFVAASRLGKAPTRSGHSQLRQRLRRRGVSQRLSSHDVLAGAVGDSN